MVTGEQFVVKREIITRLEF